MKNRTVTIGLVQMQMSEDPQKNLSKAAALVERAAKRGARIICLPELFRTRYFPQWRKSGKTPFVETIPGESTYVFASIAKKYKVVVIVPIYERTKSGRLHNSAVVINERGHLLPTYRKVHIPYDPKFYEKEYFEGGAAYRVYRTKFARFAVLICYDQWFPEAARAVALQSAEIIFYPTAIGRIAGERSKEDNWAHAWETVMRGHAIANAVHVAAVNRTGVEQKLRFFGRSFVSDSFGKVVKRASEHREEIVLAKVNLWLNEYVQRGWRFMHNRRPDTYASLLKKTKRS